MLGSPLSSPVLVLQGIEAAHMSPLKCLHLMAAAENDQSFVFVLPPPPFCNLKCQVSLF